MAKVKAKSKKKNNALTKTEKKLLLTPNEELFVFYLLSGDSRRVAYKKAYPNCGAADNVIDVKAYQVFNRDKVRIRYEEGRKELAKRRLDEAIAKGQKAEIELERIAYGDEEYDDYYKGEHYTRKPTINERMKAIIELRKDYGEIVRAQAEADAQYAENSVDLTIEVYE